ncbi:RNA-directed DNA polymerase, eukaryota [Tanacetum coccineum]
MAGESKGQAAKCRWSFWRKVGLINVYALQSNSQKELLWAAIESLINSFGAIWIIFGDFNAVRNRDKRLGCAFDDSESNDFNDFISRAGLFDLPLSGRRFTMFDRDGKKVSKLDRFLISLNFFDVWDNACVLCRTFSDHFPLLLKAEKNLLTSVDVDKREEWLMDLNNLKQLHRDDLKQKCRLKWPVEGDENSRFKECVTDRPSFNCTLFRKLSNVDASFLESTISIDEIKAAVWECDGSKAPGPDGFNFKFIKAYWEILKLGFANCVKYFEITGKIANGCNPYFVALIPKKADPLGFSDYLPISLIGCVYKVISKILASRLAKVISSVIGPNQTTFIAGRQILDGCLVANEVIRMAFEKAFDSVN